MADPNLAALERPRARNRRLILVTGREFDDFILVMPRLDIFDRVVAENGAILDTPETRAECLLAPAPPPEFVEWLRKDGASPLGSASRASRHGRPPRPGVLAAAPMPR